MKYLFHYEKTANQSPYQNEKVFSEMKKSHLIMILYSYYQKSINPFLYNCFFVYFSLLLHLFVTLLLHYILKNRVINE